VSLLPALVLVPLAFAAAAFAIPSERARPKLLPLAGALQAALVGAVLLGADAPALGGWLAVDPLSRLVLGYLAVLFLLCASYAPGYLALRPERKNRVFCAVTLVFFAMMQLVVLAHHLGLLWVALEATTLSSAPLLYFNRNPRSIEATWKYLLVSSVGVALALLGSFFLAYAALHAGLPSSLLFEDLIRVAPDLSPPWLRASFVLLLVGYGTKMGLAPMHTWKPDAYGEAPGLVGALLAGGLTTCAFAALLRFHQICVAAGLAEFARSRLLALGLFSMAVAAVFLARQRDYKRMLAYSSVEQMGILALGIGIGGGAAFGALLHLVNTGLAKAALFLAAGNIHRAFASKRVDEVGGALRRVPASGALFLLGFLAVAGSPPFGPFLSELAIVTGAVEQGRFAVAAAFLALLLVVFVGMGATVLAVVQGGPPEGAGPTRFRDGFQNVAPIAALVAILLWLGVYLPAPVSELVRAAAAFVEGRA
jgi:hydrogenase-4 component F